MNLTTEKVTEIFRDVFDDQNLLITNETSAADIEDWDSLANVDLLVSMEKEFKIKFNMKDIQSLRNVGDMISLIEKLAQS